MRYVIMRLKIHIYSRTAIGSPVKLCSISAEKSVICLMLSTHTENGHTQNIHATFVDQGLFNDELRLLGYVSHQALHDSCIDVLFNSHFHLLSDSLDLR